MSIEPPVSDGGSLMQRALCVNGHSIWRDLTTRSIVTPIVKGSHDTRLPDLLCKACGTVPVTRAGGSVYCRACSGTAAACQWCERSREHGHGNCVRHGGIGGRARKLQHFRDFLKRKRRLKLTAVKAGSR